MIVEDDRTAEQKETHRLMAVMTDRFLSGWGQAEHGTSVAAWACKDQAELANAMYWVQKRTDAMRVREVYEARGEHYRPRNAAHFHIYIWTER